MCVLCVVYPNSLSIILLRKVESVSLPWIICNYFNTTFRSTGAAGELINDIFGSSDEDDEDFQVMVENL